jgi:hypothetical protein
MVSLAQLHSWCAPLLASTFVVATALWIGTLFSVSWLSGCARMMADGPEIGRLALSLFRRWTVPSLGVSLVAGAGWVALARSGRPPGQWVYGAVLLVIPVVLSLHMAVGRHAKRVMQGNIEVRGAGMQRLALVLSLGAAIALATFRSTLAP